MNKITNILIDIGNDAVSTDVSFKFVDSGEIFGVDEFEGKTREELRALVVGIRDVLRKNKKATVLWGKE